MQQQLPEWLTDSKPTQNTSLQQLKRSPQTEAGRHLLNRFSATNDPSTGKLILFSEEQAAENCKAQYTLSNDTISLISGENLDKCFPTPNYSPAAPTIKVMIDAFGSSMVNEWLANHVMLLNVYCGCNNKLDTFQTLMFVEAIKDKFSNGRHSLNAREIMLFFFKVMKGDFGKFYGTVDPVALGDMATQYLAWRDQQQDRVSKREEELLQKKRLEEMNASASPMPEEAKEALLKLYSSFGSSRTK